MRRLFILPITVFTLMLAGCDSTESLASRVGSRFEAPQPQVRVFDADRKTVFYAAQLAMRRMDFELTKTALARGLVNGRSRLQEGASFGKAQQYTLEVQVVEVEAGKTQVSAVLRKQEESDSFAGATDIPLREHGLYDSFFENLTSVLQSGVAVPSGQG